MSSSANLMTLLRWPSRFRIEQLSRLGPWQIREIALGSASRIVATCPDQVMADAIAKFLNGDAQGAYSHLRRFHAEVRATSQGGGMTHIATPAPASMPNMKTTTPMVILAGRLGHSGSRGGAILSRADLVTGFV